MTIQTEIDATHSLEPTAVPDLVGQVQAELEAAEAAGQALADERRALTERPEAAARRRLALRTAMQRPQNEVHGRSVMIAEAMALAELGLLDDGVGADPKRLDGLTRCLARLSTASEQDTRQQRGLEAEDRVLSERERDVEARLRQARAALQQARAQQPLHDLWGLARDCAASQGRLVLLDATLGRDGSVAAWVTDGLPNYRCISGQTWRVTNFAQARRLWPHLPDDWQEQRRRLEACGCQTVPADGLVSAPELLGILERFLLRPTGYRLTSIHHTHRDANGIDRYVVQTVDGTRAVALETADMARQILGA
jgi:hypothetical protein